MSPNDLKVFVMTFDRPALLARQLDSLLSQTVRPDIVTVLDNGMNLLTRETVESRAAQGARYINTHDLGDRGNGVMAKRLCGKEGYVAFFHDDDMVSPRYFEHVLKVINAHPGVALVVGNAITRPVAEFAFSPDAPHGRGFLLDGRDWALLMFCCGACKYPFAFYRADLYDKLDILEISDTFGRAGDIPVLMRLVGLNGRAAFLTYPFCVYGIHAGQDSKDLQTLPPAFDMARFYEEFHRYMGDDLLTLAGFSYVFKCRRVLRSAYKHRCRKDVPYSEYIAFARKIGALPWKAWLFLGISNHFTQRFAEKLVAWRFRRRETVIDHLL